MLPAEAELVALCDQDDRWYPEKLAMLRGALGGAQLVYSDQRLVDRDGRVLRETMWEGRRNNHTNLASLLVANTITGAATLFRRELAELALPFPEAPGLAVPRPLARARGARRAATWPTSTARSTTTSSTAAAVVGQAAPGAGRRRRRPRGWRARLLLRLPAARAVQARGAARELRATG